MRGPVGKFKRPNLCALFLSVYEASKLALCCIIYPTILRFVKETSYIIDENQIIFKSVSKTAFSISYLEEISLLTVQMLQKEEITYQHDNMDLNTYRQRILNFCNFSISILL